MRGAQAGSAPRVAPRLAAFYRRHEGFLLVLLLAVAFRLMAIWLLRPGGFIVDNSDFEYYDSWGGLTAGGYRAFETLWSAYPPLFARLMLPIWELSARIPPWEDPRLAFHLLFSSFLLLFEIGNLILIYRLAGKLAADEIGRAAAPGNPFAAPFAEGPGILAAPLHPVLFYALLFVPVYTLLGFFDLMPLFFLLLGLDLLLGHARVELDRQRRGRGAGLPRQAHADRAAAGGRALAGRAPFVAGGAARVVQPPLARATCCGPRSTC